MQNPESQAARERARVTGKRLKAHAVGATVVFVLGVVLLVAGVGATPKGQAIRGISAWAPFFLFSGLAWYAITRARIWARQRARRHDSRR